jgi:C4-dicarboxylate-specific signal transduction histidine kinase
MDQQQRLVLAEEGMRFFGKVSAVISHEVNNVLAIINENNGLLEDFIFMARDDERPLEPDRIAESAAAIARQVKRADLIIKKMNRFAHSIDESVKRVDLGEELVLFAALAQRVAAAKEIGLQPMPQSLVLSTSPFLLLHLLWRCLAFALDSVRPGTELQLTVEPADENKMPAAHLAFRWQPAGSQGTGQSAVFPGTLEQLLLEAVAGTIELDEGKGLLRICLVAQRPDPT